MAASFVADSTLTGLVGTGSPSTTTAPAPTPKEPNGAASSRLQLGVLAGTVAMVLAGTALL